LLRQTRHVAGLQRRNQHAAPDCICRARSP
jgi:hypothetical protein